MIIKEIAQIQQLFTEYVGPMAEFLVPDCLSNSANLDEFIENLLDSIPSQEERTDFKLKARNIAN